MTNGKDVFAWANVAMSGPESSGLRTSIRLWWRRFSSLPMGSRRWPEVF